MRSCVFAAALCVSAAIASVQGQEFRRFHFKVPVVMTLDATRVAVRSDGVARKVTGYHERPGAFQYPLPQWRLFEREGGKADAGAVRGTIGAIAAGGQVGFVSPVFIDDFGGPTVVTQDILVGVREDIPAVRARAIVARYGAVIEEGVGGLPNGFKVRSHSRSGVEVLEQANELAQMAEVEFAEPDMILTGRQGLIPNDPRFQYAWALHNTGQFAGSVPGMDVGAVEAWDTTTGSAAIVTVVIDSGIQSSHPDLSGRVLTPGFDPTGQGGAGEPVSPCDNHGTPVAGCIVAKINNGIGQTGIAPNTRVASARPYVPNESCNNTFTFQASWVVDTLAWAQSIGARVTNNSNSYGGTSSAIESAYQTTYNAGIIHFGAAGNNGTGTVSYPASIAVVNSVGSIDDDGNRSSFSNWGTGLDFSAPGNHITLTDRTGEDGYFFSDYGFLDGTSFASPLAAGVAALILSENPSLMPAQVEAIMRATARDLGATGYDTDYGYGLVRADAAMQTQNGDCPLTWEEEFGSIAPSARIGYAMAYDSQRNEHVLFGGDAGSGPLSDTWIWNGASWRLASSSGPSARANSIAAFDSARNRVVLFGGRNGSTYFGDTWEWNGTAWALISTATSPAGRGTAGMVFDSARNRAVLFGGYGASGHFGDLWEYNGSDWTQKPVPPVGAREWPGMAFDSARGVVVLFGGSPPAGGSLNDTWEWNGGTGIWTLRDSGANGPPTRSNKNLAFDSARGVTVVFSGYAGSGIFRPDHWEWNGSEWTQRIIALPELRYGHTLTYDDLRGRVVMFGGEVSTGGLRNTTWEFDGTRWIPVSGTGPTARFGAGRVFVPELGGAVMFGGQTGFAQPVSPRSSEMWLQSPSGWGRLNSWGPPSRVYPCVAYAGDGELLMFGGLGEFDNGMNDLWRFADGAWQLREPSNAPAARWGATSCLFASTGRFVVFGGQFNGSLVSNALHTINAADPQNWVSFATSGPSARDYAMMAYDPVRDEAILFGGRASGGWPLDDVWRLRFVSGVPEWTFMSSLGIIHGWDSGAMFWDPGRQSILLYGKEQFGFEPGAGVVPTVYQWTGTQFIAVAGAAAPSLRRSAMMGPTSASGDIQLFGGVRVSDSQILGDAWSFNGVAEPGLPLDASGGGSFEAGSTVTLQVPVVIGASPDLRWRLEGVPLYDGVMPSGTVISGAETDSLVLSNIRPAEAGMYSCFASNPCGENESNTVLVEVVVHCPADFNGDELVDDSDFVLFASAYDLLDCADPNMTPGCPADINLDGVVDDADFVLFANAYDQLICE